MPLLPKPRHHFQMINPDQSAKHLASNVGFKFFHSKDADFILKQGSIKVGRLSDYRAMEKDTLRDDEEGIARTSFKGQVRLSDVHPSHSIHNVPLFQGRHPSRVIIKDSTYTKHYEGYLYCFSYENTHKTLASFEDDIPYDRVAKITDLGTLAKILVTMHPALLGWGYAIQPVIYRERERTPEDVSLPTANLTFEKPPKYAANVEGRMVFIPPKGYRRGYPALMPPWKSESVRSLFKEVPLPTRVSPPAPR